VGLLVGLVQGGLIRWTTPRLGEQKSIYYGLLCMRLECFYLLLQRLDDVCIPIPYCLGGICGPALQSVITKSVPSNEQGELQGALTSLMSATSIIGPPMMTNLFYFFTHDKAPFKFSGAPFFLSIYINDVSVIITYFNFKNKNAEKEILNKNKGIKFDPLLFEEVYEFMK
jgi:DHA1 family tetracycline resistance protein-like MFS transporter